MIKEDFQDLIKEGNDLILRGRYDSAQNTYNKALQINPDHYLIRNAIGELLFIKKEYVAAADNFYLAALDAANRIDIRLILNDSSSNLEAIMKKNDEVKKATHLLQNYSKKSGLALFAHQYDEPTETNPRQARINRFRIKIDPCGYCGCTELELQSKVRLDREIISIGKRFMKIMNRKLMESSQKTPPLQMIMEHLNF